MPYSFIYLLSPLHIVSSSICIPKCVFASGDVCWKWLFSLSKRSRLANLFSSDGFMRILPCRPLCKIIHSSPMQYHYIHELFGYFDKVNTFMLFIRQLYVDIDTFLINLAVPVSHSAIECIAFIAFGHFTRKLKYTWEVWQMKSVHVDSV